MSNPPAEPSNRGQSLFVLGAAFALVVAGTLAYRNSFAGVFTFDDVPMLQGLANQPFRWDRFPGKAMARPVLQAVFSLNYAICGIDPAGYHVVNLLIHLTAGLLLFGLVRRSLRLERFQGHFKGFETPLAFTIALLWLVHPLQTESVTYIVQRAESLMGLFFLALLYCVLRGSQSRQAGWWYAGAVVVFMLGCGTKQVMATAPLVAFLYDRSVLTGSWRETLRRRRWLYLAFLPGLLWVFFDVAAPLFQPAPASETPASGPSAGFSVRGISPLEYLQTQPLVLLHYLRLSAWPNELVIDYGWPVTEDFSEAVLPGLAILLLLSGAVYLLIRHPAAGFLAMSFFLILAPTSSVLPIKDPIAEHRMYLPLACLISLFVIAAFSWLSHPRLASRVSVRVAGLVLIALLAVPLMVRTWNRNGDYRSEVSLWKQTAAAAPHNPRAWTWLGQSLEKQGQLPDALESFERALAIQRQDSRTEFQELAASHCDIGIILLRQNELAKAERHFRKALEIYPNYYEGFNNLGALLLKREQFAEAETCFAKAVELRPDMVMSRRNLATILLKLNRYPEAIAQLRHILDQQPQFAWAWHNLGAAHEKLGRPSDADHAYRQASELDPENPKIRFDWGNLNLRRGNHLAALQHFSKAVEIAPSRLEYRVQRAGALAILGHDALAARDYRLVLEQLPADSPLAQKIHAYLAESSVRRVQD